MTLEHLASGNSRAHLLQLRYQLQSVEKGSISINDYILKMRSIADNLTAAGHVISDEDLILYILRGLGSKYDPVVVNLTSRYEAISLSEVQFLLPSFEMRLESLSATANIDLIQSSVNVVTNNTRKNFKNSQSFVNGGNFNSRGDRCGRGRSNSGNLRPVFQICGKTGPLAPRCYSRFDHNVQDPKISSQPNSAPRAFVATPTTVNDPSWYVDSGTTDNVIADLNNLSLRSDYKGKDKLTIGQEYKLGPSQRDT